MFEDADLIHCYTRAQALEDGVLVDVSETAKDAGFRVPVAITQAAWADCIHWTEEDSARVVHQNESARLWDVLWMARLAAGAARGGDRTSFNLLRLPRDGKTCRPMPVTLLLDIGPGDEGEPGITIGFAEDF